VVAGFGPSEDIRELRDRVRTFVDTEVVPVEAEALRTDRQDLLRELMARAKADGLWALGHPKELGGGGLTTVDYTYIGEAAGRSAPATAALGAHTLQDALLLARYGDGGQRDRWLDPLVAGDLFLGVAMTEPEVAGSDPKVLRTTADPVAGGWVLDGHKWFTSWADRAAAVVVFARTDPTAGLERQLSAFLVPTDTPGFRVERLLTTMGGPSTLGELRLDRVRVPDDHLLGERGAGFAIAQERLGPNRLYEAMRWLGQAERAFEMLCVRAVTRYAHGSLLAEKGEIQRYVAETAAAIQATRLLTLDAARRLDAGEDARLAISMVKFQAARMLHDAIDRAIQVHGAAGLSDDLPLERMYRDARAARLYDGPDEVHRMVVARRLLDDPETNAPWA
jgi:acyl-CoA dehydrogenase